MKRLSLTLLFACLTLALTAQEVPIHVKFQGDKPTIKDIAWAFLSTPIDVDDDGEEVYDQATNPIRMAWIRQRDGIPQPEGMTLDIDQKNGFVFYEYKLEDGSLRSEMCYWNESDGKHKLFAFNTKAFDADGKPLLTETDGIMFYRYENATKTMTWCPPPGFEVEYYNVSYSLPRSGKDLLLTRWREDGIRQQEVLKWNGHGFSATAPSNPDVTKNWFKGTWDYDEGEWDFGSRVLTEYNLITLKEDTVFYFLKKGVDRFSELSDRDVESALVIRKGTKYIDGGYEFDCYIPDPRQKDGMLRFGISTLNGKEVFVACNSYKRK